MERKETDTAISSLMDTILRAQCTDAPLMYRSCLALRRMADEKHDLYAACYAENYLCSYYLFYSPSKTSDHTLLRQLNHALELCRRSGYDSLLLQVYNMFGIMLSGRGEYSQAVDYFTRGLTHAALLHDYEAEAYLYGNLCDIYMKLHHYKRALPYCKKSLSLLRRIKAGYRKERYLQITALNMAEIQLCLGHNEDVLALMARFDPTVTRIPVKSFVLAQRSLRCAALFALGQPVAAAALVELVIQEHEVDYDACDFFLSAMYRMVDVGLGLHDENSTRTLLELLRVSEYVDSMPEYRLKYIELEIAYHEQFGPETALFPLFRRHYALERECAQRQDAERCAAVTAKIEALQSQERQRWLQQQNAQLKELSGLDELTQLANRRTLNDKFARSLAYAQTHGVTLGVLVFDIDHFKQFNDSCGHLIGDSLIRAVAQSLLGADTRYFAARFGGDEFVVLCTGCTDAEIEYYLLRVRHDFKENQKSLSENMPCGTLSAGYCNLVPGRDDTEKSMFAKADKALYHAKKSRDTAVRYSDGLCGETVAEA